jgi:urea transporter
MSTTSVFRRPIALPGARLLDWVLRGIGQVVFQNNWLTGVVILVAIFYNSWVYGIACVVGTLVATLTAMALKADRALVRDGLFGFNGALLAIGLNAYMSRDFTNGALPGWRLYLYIAIGAAFTSVIMSALLNLLAPYRVPALTAPFVVTGWLFIFAVLRFGQLEPGPLLDAALPKAFEESTSYSWTTWYQGIGKGIGEIFFQDNWITGFLIVVAIALNSRIGAAMALLGSVAGAAVAMVLGAEETSVRLGLFGFNPALTAIAIGGFFFVFTLRGFLYAVFGVLVTTWTWAAIAVALSPMGMPTFTSAFVVVTWLMIMAKDGFKAVTAVPPAEATTPEDNRARWRAAALEVERGADTAKAPFRPRGPARSP